MAMIMGLAPIVAPLIGGGLQTVFGWRASFVLVFAGGALAVTLAALLLPETRRRDSAAPPPARRRRGELRPSWRAIAPFLLNIAMASLSFAGLFAWISASPFVLQNLYGLSPMAYGVAFATAACGFITGTSIAARFVERIGLDRTYGIGVTLLTISGIGLVTAGGGVAARRTEPRGAGGILFRRHGLVMPQSFAASLQPFPERAGAASSLGGVIQQSCAAIMGVVVGPYGRHHRMAAGAADGARGVVDACGVVVQAATRGAGGKCVAHRPVGWVERLRNPSAAAGHYRR